MSLLKEKTQNLISITHFFLFYLLLKCFLQECFQLILWQYDPNSLIWLNWVTVSSLS